MSTPRIWEAIESGNLQALTELLLEQPTVYGEVEDTARLLIENNERRKPTFEVAGVLDDKAAERWKQLEKLARDLYFAISDTYEYVDRQKDAEVVEGAYQGNWAMITIQNWDEILKRAERVLGLKK